MGGAGTIGCALQSASTSRRALFGMPQHIFVSFSPSFRYQYFEDSFNKMRVGDSDGRHYGGRHNGALLFLQPVEASAESAHRVVMPTCPFLSMLVGAKRLCSGMDGHRAMIERTRWARASQSSKRGAARRSFPRKLL